MSFFPLVFLDNITAACSKSSRITPGGNFFYPRLTGVFRVMELLYGYKDKLKILSSQVVSYDIVYMDWVNIYALVLMSFVSYTCITV